MKQPRDSKEDAGVKQAPTMAYAETTPGSHVNIPGGLPSGFPRWEGPEAEACWRWQSCSEVFFSAVLPHQFSGVFL